MNIDEYIIGESEEIQQAKIWLKKLSEVPKIPVFIYGEPGSGRTLFARTLHTLSGHDVGRSFRTVDFSQRRDDELIVMSHKTMHRKFRELFTGQGTSVLYNIADWPSILQKRVLYELEKQHKERASLSLKEDVLDIDSRIVVITNDMARLKVERGIFNEELFYRLNIVSIPIPPLRERLQDIELLLQHIFKTRTPDDMGLLEKVGRKKVVSALQAYSWPSNVRELIEFVDYFLLVREWEVAQDWLIVRTTGSGFSAIIKSIEFPPEHFQAGISILNYFGTILREKYPEKHAKIRIEQDDMKVNMVIETLDGDREIIEAALSDYGKVVIGEMAPENFMTDPLHVIALKQKLELVQQELRMTRDLLAYVKNDKEKRMNTLEEQVTMLHTLIATVMQHSTTNVNAITHVSTEAMRTVSINISSFLRILSENNQSIKKELGIIADKISIMSPSQDDIAEVKSALSIIKSEEPSSFGEITMFWEQFGMGVTTSVWASVITETINKLCS